MKENDGALQTIMRYVPSGPKRDELMQLICIGAKFKRQQAAGKRPGHLSHIVLECANHIGHRCSFEQLLNQLEIMATRREVHGDKESPVEKVNKEWEIVTIHFPKRGRVHVPFKTLRNHLTNSKKRLLAAIPVSGKAGI